MYMYIHILHTLVLFSNQKHLEYVNMTKLHIPNIYVYICKNIHVLYMHINV